MFSRGFLWSTHAVLLVTSVLSVTSSAQAYRMMSSVRGSHTRWLASEITMQLDPEVEALLPEGQARSAALMAMDTWRGYAGVPAIGLGDEHASAFDPHDFVNAIHVLDPWPYAPEQIALTFPRRKPDGEIVSADIVLNGEVEWAVLADGQTPAPAVHDLPSVLAHELGHVLGLDESEVPGSTMWPLTALGETHKRVLGADDEQGVIDLYSRALEAPAAASCTVGDAPGRSSSTPTVFALALGVLSALGVRARRRAADSRA